MVSAPPAADVPRAARLGGVDRYETAAAISRETFAPGTPVAYLATGADFADALASGAAAGVRGGPILLTGTTSVPEATVTELHRLRPERIVLVGGELVIAPAVADALRPLAGSDGLQRLAGGDRLRRPPSSPLTPSILGSTPSSSLPVSGSPMR